MLTLAHWIFLVFVFTILITLSLRKPPILAAAIGLFGVGLADSGNLLGAVQISFRALSMAFGNLLSVILLIGMVVGLTNLLKETGADQLLVKPLLRIKTLGSAYWAIGIVMWGLTLLIWPTPAISLLGAVVIPVLARVGINPVGMAVSLTIFGEGLGLAGDFVIQGAPSLLSKAAGIPVYTILTASFPVVLLSGFLAAGTGWFILKNYRPGNLRAGLEKQEISGKQTVRGRVERISPRRVRLLAFLMSSSYILAVLFIIIFKIRGEGASALIGGITLLVLCLGSLLKDGKGAFQSFIEYLKEGLRFSIGVFAPIILMSSFFFLGTKTGYEQILHHEGFGFFSDFAYRLAEWLPLSKWSVGILIILIAILGSMDGSGFSSLPLVGGISVALAQAAELSPVPLAVLGQVTGIWTGAALIPWGFSAVTAAIAGVKVHDLIKYTLPAYFIALLTAFVWTLFSL